MRSTSVFLVILLSALAVCQTTPAEQNKALASDAANSPAASLSEDQIREIIRKSADNDIANDKKLRNYTYVERQEEKHLDGKGNVKSTEIKTYDVMEIYGEQVQKLVSKDDKPLSEKDAQKEDEKIQKVIDKRKDESDSDREKRLKKEEKDREDERKFVSEVADAYNFRFVGMETIEGRENYVIDADPKPGYEPKMKEAKILPKFRFRAWIDKDEIQWKKLDAECIDTVSFGLLLFRLHKGSHAMFEQTRVNDEVWLQQRLTARVDGRIALLKGIDVDIDISDRDFKKFSSDTKITTLGETSSQ
ncbi:MAG TPA: hypothetical protein VMB18_19300 [Terriglobales bacterium]|nr:hypothetical protein [Terriglobales bacterium]